MNCCFIECDGTRDLTSCCWALYRRAACGWHSGCGQGPRLIERAVGIAKVTGPGALVIAVTRQAFYPSAWPHPGLQPLFPPSGQCVFRGFFPAENPRGVLSPPGQSHLPFLVEEKTRPVLPSLPVSPQAMAVGRMWGVKSQAHRTIFDHRTPFVCVVSKRERKRK